MNSRAAASRKRQSNRSILNRRNASSMTGEFNSVRKDGIERVFQSRPELLHLGILDVHPNVECFYSQPETFELADGGAYTPDALIHFRRGRRPLYREVKPLAKLIAKPWPIDRIEAILDACDQRDADFEIVTEDYWLAPIRLSIASATRHAVKRIGRLEKDIVRHALEDGALAIAELAAATGLGHDGRHAALALVADGIAMIRRDRCVCDTTVVRLTGHA